VINYLSTNEDADRILGTLIEASRGLGDDSSVEDASDRSW
jgi:hypothetical protein